MARRQLLAIGLTPEEIQVRLDAGRLHAAHRGVYKVGHEGVTGHGRWLAAVLACGEGAVLSHRSAGALWRIMESPAARIDVTVGRGGRARRTGIAIHRTELTAANRTCRFAIPVTTPARTLCDLAAVVGPRRLEGAFGEADRLGLLDVSALRALCERGAGRRGIGRLRALLAHHRGPEPETRSALEHRFLKLCRGSGLPAPAVNVPVAGFEVDAVWPAQRLVVELDGYAFHNTRASFESDRARDAALQLAGYRVLRVTHRRLLDDPRSVTETIRTMLTQGR